MRFDALGGGGVVLDWYYHPRGEHPAGHHRSPVLVAAGTRTFAAKATRSITVKLTIAGRRLLTKKTSINLTARGTLTAPGSPALTATKTFTLTR